MNTLQSAKYALVKAQLKGMSFDWIDSPSYSTLVMENLFIRLKRLSIPLMLTPIGLL